MFNYVVYIHVSRLQHSILAVCLCVYRWGAHASPLCTAISRAGVKFNSIEYSTPLVLQLLPFFAPRALQYLFGGKIARRIASHIFCVYVQVAVVVRDFHLFPHTLKKKKERNSRRRNRKIHWQKFSGPDDSQRSGRRGRFNRLLLFSRCSPSNSPSARCNLQYQNISSVDGLIRSTRE
jgi:hypothetical protein